MLHIHSLLRGHALLPSIQLRRLFFSTGASATSSVATASPDPNFLVEYLMNACGFSADDASKVSKSFPRFRSAEKADAVLGFLRSQGIDGANLRKIISSKPGFLCRDVENSLAPKFKILRDMGLSESDIANAVLRHPVILSLNVQNTLLPRLKVWESLFGSREILFRQLRSCNRFMSTSIKNVVRPNLNFLRDECGIPEDRVSRVIKRHPGFIVQNPESLRALVDRAEGIGIPRESKMFLWILDVLHGVSREKFEVQVKLLHSFGWSNSDFTAAFKKRPAFLWHSTEVLQRKMEFFIKDVEIKPSEIANHPIVLAFSLEKRLIPRFQLMKILKSEGLWTSNIKLHNFFSSPDPKFLQSFVLPYKDKLPELAELKGNNPNCKFI
ncbi:transcription termination factor MTERF15, mitochondrial-like [Zingiber officinale]|nr:transcription termination factor MTERF15, mitochondrial-like [Zingiber officinale]XP_042422773.1 transcription termination factor MTERF15, mitochondrial-like [Zingiber officinale]